MKTDKNALSRQIKVAGLFIVHTSMNRVTDAQAVNCSSQNISTTEMDVWAVNKAEVMMQGRDRTFPTGKQQRKDILSHDVNSSWSRLMCSLIVFIHNQMHKASCGGWKRSRVHFQITEQCPDQDLDGASERKPIF